MGACRRRLRSDLDLAALLFNEGIIDEIRQILSIRAPFLKTGRYWHLGCRWALEVVQVRTARRRQGVAKGCGFSKSGYERTDLGDAGERCASIEGSGKAGANRFPHDPPGKRMWMRSCAICKALLHKLRLCESVRCQCGWIW